MLVTMSDNRIPELDFDLHIHTFHSPCGQDEMQPTDIIRAAVGRGITRLGITDHFYPFSDPGMFDDVRRRIRDACSTMADPPRVFLGCEAEIMSPGRTMGSAELAERLDYVMVAFTHFQNIGITDPPPTGSLRETAEYYLRMFEYAVSLKWAHTVAHPFLVIPDVCSPELLDHIDESDVMPHLETARENGVAMEMSPRALFPWQREFSLRFYRWCKEAGVKFTIGSDAHSLDRVGDVRVLRPLITSLGLSAVDFSLPG